MPPVALTRVPQVVLKILKHCHEDGTDVTGVLMGLIQDAKMEVTNCFALPRDAEEEDMDDAEYQSLMIRHLRNANVDHLVVGAYQASPCGSAVAKRDTVDLLTKQVVEQGPGSESIALLYDPIRGQKGFLSLKAVRLTPVAEKLLRDAESGPDPLRNSRISFDKFFEEVPLKIRNSHLITGMMCEIDEELRVDEGKQLLDMGSVSVLEKSLQSLMKCVEDVGKWANHQRQTSVKQQQIVKENQMRQSRGEPLLTEEEAAKILKQYNPIHRIEALLNSSQTLNYCQQASSFASQNIGKLFMSKAMQVRDGK